MLAEHSSMWWPWKVRRDQDAEIDQIIANARASMEEEMIRCNELPDNYHFDVLTDGKAVKVGTDTMVPGVGKVESDVVIAGIVVAWRKGTPKPKLVSTGKIA